MTRPVPVPDALSAEFWAAAGRGVLAVQRCAGCLRYAHPPVALCSDCLSDDLRFTPVSGVARVYSFSETVSGARHPAFRERVPYLVGLVEIVEQEGVFLFTNFPGAHRDDLTIGTEVRVEFEEITPGVAIPQFRPIAEVSGG